MGLTERDEQLAPVGYEDGYVTVGEMTLHYVDYGGTGEPVVALHGLVQNAHAFDGIAPILVPHRRLLALDMRGRGGSDWGPPESYRWSYYLRDLRGFLAALNLSRIALIGTSMGGTLAMLYAMAHPGQVTRLVMNDTSLNANRAGVVRASLRIGRAPATFLSLSHATAWFLRERDGLDRLEEDKRQAWVSHFLIPAETGGLRFNCDPVIIRRASLIPPDIGPRRPWSHRWTVWQQVKRLNMPVLILRGARSDVVPRVSAKRMAAALPAARWAEVPGAGHAPTLYEKEAHTVLRDFFALPADPRVSARRVFVEQKEADHE
jgi:pimeloyl-ACP methyl ester carboxylesterase